MTAKATSSIQVIARLSRLLDTLAAHDDHAAATALQQLNRLPTVQSVTRAGSVITVRGSRVVIAHVGAWLAKRPLPERTHRR